MAYESMPFFLNFFKFFIWYKNRKDRKQMLTGFPEKKKEKLFVE